MLRQVAQLGEIQAGIINTHVTDGWVSVIVWVLTDKHEGQKSSKKWLESYHSVV